MSLFCFQPEDTSHVFSGITMEPELYTHCLQINVVQYCNEKITVPGLRSAGVWCHPVRRIGPSTMWHPSELHGVTSQKTTTLNVTLTTTSLSNFIILPKYATNISTTTLAGKLIRPWDLTFSQQWRWRFESPGPWHCAVVWLVPNIMYDHTDSIFKLQQSK